MNQKPCTKCNRVDLTEADFYKNSKKCKFCTKEYVTEYKKNNKEKVAQWSKNSSTKAKTEMLEAYGKECACCGENNIGFLTLDHIETNGAEERREANRGGGYVFYAWLRTKGWPSGYQVLCYNCNCARYYLGVCPHEQ